MQVMVPRRAGRPAQFDRAEAILAAARLFWCNGYSGTSTRALSSSLGMSTSSIYAAFGSKAGLFEEAVRTYAERYRAIYEEACRQSSFTDALTQLLHRSIDEFTEPRKGHPGCLLSSAVMTDMPDIIDTRAYLAELHSSNERTLRERIRQACTDGHIVGPVAPAVLTSLVQALWHGLSVQSNQGVHRDELRATADLALTNLIAFAARP